MRKRIAPYIQTDVTCIVVELRSCKIPFVEVDTAVIQ